MKVAVLTLTRDRLDYTQHCFARLRQYAGCAYDHYLLDQGSTDGTPEWLEQHRDEFKAVVIQGENIGIHRGHNTLLKLAGDNYDAYVTFDNDCEFIQHSTLAACVGACRYYWIVSPLVNGLIHTPQPGPETLVGPYRVGPYQWMGGICRAMPREFVTRFRFNEDRPYWGKDEEDVGNAAAQFGFGSGYLLDWQVNHYETTRGQMERHPVYFERKRVEIGGAVP